MNSLEEYLGTKSVLNCPQCCCHAASLQEEEDKISRQLHGGGLQFRICSFTVLTKRHHSEKRKEKMKDEMTQAAHHVTFGDTTVDGGKSKFG